MTEGVPHLALGSTSLPDTAPTREQHAGRAVTNGVQKLQHVKSAIVNIGSTAWLPSGYWGHVLVRVLGQIGLVESGIPDLPIASIHLMGGCSCSGINNRQIT